MQQHARLAVLVTLEASGRMGNRAETNEDF